jgi:hypothetical protein
MTGDRIHVYRSRRTGRGEAEDTWPGVYTVPVFYLVALA